MISGNAERAAAEAASVNEAIHLPGHEPGHEPGPPPGLEPPPGDAIRVLVRVDRDPRAALPTLAALAPCAGARLAITVAVHGDPGPLVGVAQRLGVALARWTPDADALALLGVAPGCPLLLVEAGALPPARFAETLLAHPRDAVVVASTSSGGGPEALADLGPADGPSDALREAWGHASRELMRAWPRVREGVSRVTSPIVALHDAHAHQGALARWWREPQVDFLPLARDARVVLARDLVVWRLPPVEHPGAPSRLGARLADPLVPPVVERLAPAELHAVATKLEGALAAGPRPTASLFLARLCARTGRAARARIHALAALERWPDHAGAALVLAEAEAVGGSGERARRRLDELRQAVPHPKCRRARLLACVGESWRAGGDQEQAEACFAAALALDPGEPLARVGRGALHLESGAFEDALEDFSAATRRDPLRTRGWYGLGRTWAVCGEPQRAREALARALALDPSHRETRTLADRLAGRVAALPRPAHATLAEIG